MDLTAEEIEIYQQCVKDLEQEMKEAMRNKNTSKVFELRQDITSLHRRINIAKANQKEE